MINAFNGETADEVWLRIREAFQHGASQSELSRCGNTDEIIHGALSISNPRQRWVTSRQPAMNPAFALAEVVWILAGRNDSESLNYFNSQYPKFAGYGKTYHGAYGFRLRRQFGIDQLERAYLALLNKSESRQVVLQIWDSRVDFPSPSGDPVDTDIPCNLVSMLKVRNGALEWFQVIRSNDFFRGLPHNLIQFTSLQEIMAGWLGLELGTYNQISDSLHLYESDKSKVLDLSIAEDCETNLDDLRCPKDLSESYIVELASAIDFVKTPSNNAEDLLHLLRKSTLPPAYKNLMCILFAEGARRRKEPEIVKSILRVCTNGLLIQLFNRWSSNRKTGVIQ
jgi:thymidylate synthase